MNLLKDIKRTFKTISLIELSQVITDFCGLIERDGFIPERIIYIERAGRIIGHQMADYFSCPVVGIKVINIRIKNRDNYSRIFQIFPKKLTHYMKIIERNFFYHKGKKYLEFSFLKTPRNFKGKTLLVDDAIDSGQSLKAAVDFLYNNGFQHDQLKTAVITTTMSNPFISADYSYYKETVCYFPWAIDSSERSRYEEIYRSLELANL